jgi:hypothetical protein
MRLILVCLVGVLAGCGAENTAPPPFTAQQRDTIKQNLTKLGAKVTAEIPEEVYLTLRNTHVEVRDLGGIIEGSSKTGPDVRDFGVVTEAVAKGFLQPGELNEFKAWLQKALAPRAPAAMRSEYQQFKVTLSRNPLHVVFTRKQSPESE